MSSIQAANIRKRLTNIFSKDPQSNLYQIIEGIGTAFDAVDPGQIQLSKQFSVTAATGQALDRHGADHELPRRAGESDASYQARILSQLPVYAQGPTPNALIDAVTPFTGFPPTLNERGQTVFSLPFSFAFDGGLPSRWDGVNTHDFSILTFPFMFGSFLPASLPSGKGTVLSGVETYADNFVIDITMVNPNSVVYQQQDVVKAVKTAKRSIATVILHWEDGTRTTVQ